MATYSAEESVEPVRRDRRHPVVCSGRHLERVSGEVVVVVVSVRRSLVGKNKKRLLCCVGW